MRRTYGGGTRVEEDDIVIHSKALTDEVGKPKFGTVISSITEDADDVIRDSHVGTYCVRPWNCSVLVQNFT
jgi:hypothetical protein